MLKCSFNKSNFSKLSLTVMDNEITTPSTGKNLYFKLSFKIKSIYYCTTSNNYIGRTRNCLSDESTAIIIHACIHGRHYRGDRGDISPLAREG